MKCNCCDRDLSDNEVIFNQDLDAWEMCKTCLDVALEAAGKRIEDQDEEGELPILVEEWDVEFDPRYTARS